ncbi:MAG TPA: hypothetical protein VJM76_00135, partial [Gammaproteobacteria bacterium]|nr:hypothetical protein [Gammaproteobacteria bacterium]
KINQQTSSGLILDLREAATSSGSPQRDLTAYVSHKLTSEAKIQGYVGKGFSDGSADWGGGAMVTVGF